jgi:hypothetical protein
MQTPDQYFDTWSEWWDHLPPEIVSAAREHFHEIMAPGRVGRSEAAERAWSYAQGASRFMKKPEA